MRQPGTNDKPVIVLCNTHPCMVSSRQLYRMCGSQSHKSLERNAFQVHSRQNKGKNSSIFVKKAHFQPKTKATTERQRLCLWTYKEQ